MNKKILLFLYFLSFYTVVVVAQNDGLMVDTDSTTINIPSRREVNLDKGFYGNITIQLVVKLKPLEKYEFRYAKNKKITFVNVNNDKSMGYSTISYKFIYPAKKLRKYPMIFEVTKLKSLDAIDFTKVKKLPDNNFIMF